MNFSIEVFHPEVPQKDTTIQHKKRPNKLPKALPSPTGFNYRRGLMIKMHFRNVPLHMCCRSQVLFVGLPLGISLSSSIGTRKGGHTFWSNLLLKKVKGHIDLSILLHTPFPKKKTKKTNKQRRSKQRQRSWIITLPWAFFQVPESWARALNFELTKRAHSSSHQLYEKPKVWFS